MALITPSILLGIADRAAEQFNILQAAYAASNVEGTGWYYDRVVATEDPQITIPTEGPYHAQDLDMNVSLAIQNTGLGGIIWGMNAHFNQRDGSGNPLQAGGWDGYLRAHDVRVSWWFNRIYVVVANTYMLAVNVFSETDDIFGTCEVEAGPTLSFVNGINYGNGSIVNLANGTYFAATQLKIVVGTMGATDIDLRLGVKDVDNLPTTIDVTIPANSAPGDEIPIGTTSSRFLDVTSASYVPSGSEGTVGDTFTIQNLKERQIAL